MDEISFRKLLCERNVVLVHFSHHSTMNYEVEFPGDLIFAVKNHVTETLSCCALFPGYKMDLPGSIGVILEPTLEQVLTVCGFDSGSSNYGGKEGSLGVPPTQSTINQSLIVSEDGYNEWRILGARPIGFFVADPDNIYVKKKVMIPIGEELHPVFTQISIPLRDVCVELNSIYPKLPIYSMGPDGFLRLCTNSGSE